MTASPSTSSSFFCASSSRCSSPKLSVKSPKEPCRNAARGDQPEEVHFAPDTRCELIAVPFAYHVAFAYLHGTQLFFFAVLRKLNRAHVKDKRVCFVTDYTINLAAADTGAVSRCSKVEDAAELICDVRSRAVGIRMQGRPFAVAPQIYLHWNCFYEMPVDLLLFAESDEQLGDLVRVLRFVYRHCTAKELPCRMLQPKEEWEAKLVLWADGSRVKKNAMAYHRVPTPPPAADSPRFAGPPSSNGLRSIEVPRTRGAHSASTPGRDARLGSALASSPPPRPPPRRSFSRPMEGARRLELDESPATPPRIRDPGPQRPIRHPVAEGFSATRRELNPLARDAKVERKSEAVTAGVPSSGDDSNSSKAARARRLFVDDDAALGSEDALAGLYSPLTSSPPPPDREQTTRSKVKALEATVQAQRLCIRELRRSGYSKECELDDLKRHLSVASSSHGKSSAPEPSSRRHQIQLPKDEQISADGRQEEGGQGREHKGKQHSRHKHHRHPMSDHNDKHLPRTRASSVCSSSNHEANLSTVKPIQGGRGRGAACPVAKDGGGADRGEKSTASVREAELQLTDALSRHRVFEETVWSYYKALPAGLQEELRTYHRDGSHKANGLQRRRSTEEELKCLQELVRQSERAHAEDSSNTSSAPTAETMAVVGDQIDAFAQELGRRQYEIDALRRQLRDKTGTRH
ncbi:hypothetical protein ABB37_04815 [Leptomonas pyrrhocoris]|uniref:Uncharacterized protein n=1 Tax=Leptomonas pyrrhocoris TaxID=157538 RepID=A0A0N0DVN7_LEPPY|nr:hypothetical protein ABB37_04815 [Leptomonas pyrrhocoris]XP_015659061.1 hypothetical protein ABB37_04815 [Leptomonas pyrrhocoris]KPA80621.1 hypothetical protein ABB37_04815 [Leptomonas pyrrhocoris]KPA80622.1 hypothetical protein ABB37_04815 [Leptomonas pyrrhocoris]|eukprot:XP_015659060.1 hypothetical protein ABB37_04815 [Leptomonas pyrrhocoris]